jgi:riboflavin synthase
MGRIRAKEAQKGAVRLEIEAGDLAAEPALGDSVAIDGCCLTVVDQGHAWLAFDAIPETLRRTTLGAREPGEAVNLELPLRAGDRLGGHFVQGHVDAVAEVLDRREENGDVVLTLSIPEALAGQIVEKGSVAVDGVSLTVSAQKGATFGVALIPHTLEVTTLGRRKKGDAVNLEGDILAKYVASLVQPS